MANGISETAIITASLRALSNYETLTEYHSKDGFAEYFLPQDRKSALLDPASRSVIKKAIPIGMLEYVVARTKFFDSVLLESLQSECTQIVIMGAGFDSRALRFEEQARNAIIFELDVLPTQTYKLQKLAEHDVVVPPNVRFIPTDIEKFGFIEQLFANGYDARNRTLFLLEGLTFYLSPVAVAQILDSIRKSSAQWSRVCFDCQTMMTQADLIDTGLNTEQIKFGIAAGGINQFAENAKYRLIEHLGSIDMENRFILGQDGKPWGRIAPIMNFILIEH